MRFTVLGMLFVVLVLSSSAQADVINRFADEVFINAERLRDVVRDVDYSREARLLAARTINDIRRNLDQLESYLSRGGDRPHPRPRPVPIVSATCNLEVGGNFFVPDTKVHCTVYGGGVAGYEIRVISEYGDSVEFQGQLDPRQSPQTFVTEEKRVGGRSVTYVVNMLTQDGFRVQVATLGK